MEGADQVRIGTVLSSLVLDLRRDADDARAKRNAEWMSAVCVRAGDAIRRFSPPGTAYSTRTAQETGGVLLEFGDASRIASYQIELLAGMSKDYLARRFTDFIAVARDEVFGDFLDIATAALTDDRGASPGVAAVIAGTVLEDHLRHLAQRRGIALDADGKSKGAGRLNEDLTAKGAITRIESTNIRVWYGIRNEAAHAFDKVDRARAERLIEDVRSFIARHPE